MVSFSRTVPSGAGNTYSMPIDIALYGDPGENKTKVQQILQRYHIALTGGAVAKPKQSSTVDRGITGVNVDITGTFQVSVFPKCPS